MSNEREFKAVHIVSILALLLTILAVFFSYQAFTSLHQLKEAEDRRFQAFRLTEQLRLTSVNLSMMARAYVTTGDNRFKENFYRILAIRDGLEPRPLHYYRAYWDFQLVGFKHWENGDAHPWDELFAATGLTDGEMALLRHAKSESDSLAALAERAFHAIEGRFPDEDGSFSVKGKPNRELGLQLLYSPEYLQGKARIMGYINRSFEQLEARTTPLIHQLAADHERQTALAIAAFATLILLLLVHTTIRSRLKESWIAQMQAEIDQKTTDLIERHRAHEQSINELKDMQRLLLESEKFSTLGNLVSSVTHEINTPLSIGITASTHAADTVQKLCSEYESNTLSNKRFRQYLESIQTGMSMVYTNLDRVSKLMGSFKEISVDQSLDETRRINLADYIHKVTLTLLPKYGHTSIQLVVDVPEDLELKTEPGALSQVVTNIVVNAYTHAFDGADGGRILIRAQKQSSDIVLTISDNGMGMDSEVIQHIYQPFYTTKRDCGGTGLGMNIVYKLVTDRLKGKIHCESAPGQGCRFFITLPEQLPAQATDKVVPIR